MKIAALVLAAGLSRRYGDSNKLLALFEGEPMVLKVVQTIRHASIDRVVVVTGHQGDLIDQVLREVSDLQLVRNNQYQLGMSSSIVAGSHFLDGMDGCMICLADLPWLTTTDYTYFATRFREENKQDQILIPTHEGKSGHPVIFGSNFFTQLRGLPLSDHGAREIIENNLTKVKNIAVNHRRILRDIDTPDLLEQ